MLLVITRTLGLIALLFTGYWWLGAISFVLLCLVGIRDSSTGMIKFNSSAPRVVVEIICGAIGFFGIVHAPMIESETAVLLAVIAGVVVAIELIYPLANRRGPRY